MTDWASVLAAYEQQKAAKEQVKESNPWASGAGIANALQQQVIGSAADPRYSMGEKIGAGLILGLIGGGLTQAQNNWQSKAETEYMDVFSNALAKKQLPERDYLNADVFSNARNQAKLYEATRGAEAQKRAQDAELELINAARLEEIKEDPRARQALAAGDMSVFSRPGSRVIGSQAENESSVADQIAYKVPKGLQSKAVEELGLTNQVQEALKTANNALDTAYANVGIRESAFGDWAPNMSESAKLKNTARAQIISAVLPIWTGPLDEKDAKRIIDPFVPDVMDTPKTVEAKKQALAELIRNNSKPTPVLETYGVNPLGAQPMAQRVEQTPPTAATEGQGSNEQVIRSIIAQAKRDGLSMEETRQRVQMFSQGAPATTQSGTPLG